MFVYTLKFAEFPVRKQGRRVSRPGHRNTRQRAPACTDIEDQRTQSCRRFYVAQLDT